MTTPTLEVTTATQLPLPIQVVAVPGDLTIQVASDGPSTALVAGVSSYTNNAVVPLQTDAHGRLQVTIAGVEPGVSGLPLCASALSNESLAIGGAIGLGVGLVVGVLALRLRAALRDVAWLQRQAEERGERTSPYRAPYRAP